tara:strand:+ start:2569 stop:2697 length:129 start_codon:yes stop_codon:yes gene_type:complete
MKNNKLKYSKNDYGYYRIHIDNKEFNSLREARAHIKNKGGQK